MEYGYYSAPQQFMETGSGSSENGSMGILIVLLIALVIAFAVVSYMKAKLQTAKKRHNAADYVQRNSLNLFVRQDHYLYTSEQRRRIQQPQNRQPMQKGR